MAGMLNLWYAGQMWSLGLWLRGSPQVGKFGGGRQCSPLPTATIPSPVGQDGAGPRPPLPPFPHSQMGARPCRFPSLQPGCTPFSPESWATHPPPSLQGQATTPLLHLVRMGLGQASFLPGGQAMPPPHEAGSRLGYTPFSQISATSQLMPPSLCALPPSPLCAAGWGPPDLARGGTRHCPSGLWVTNLWDLFIPKC